MLLLPAPKTRGRQPSPSVPVIELPSIAGAIPGQEVNHIWWTDVMNFLRALPDNYVNCVVTSPPYYGLRDYGVEGQLGSEQTPQQYIAKMVEVFREVRRVLRKDGVCWLNIGDSYWGGKGQSGSQGKEYQQLRVQTGKSFSSPEAHVGGPKKTRPTDRKSDIYKPKDLMLIPHRLAIALQDDGWWIRAEIIWHKPNCMPESVTDRPTRNHEQIWMLTKSEKYWYDAEAVREEAEYGRREGTNWARARNGDPKDSRVGLPVTTKGADPTAGRNARSVWTIPTQPTSEAHFATFPQELVKRCILAGCPDKVCSKCGKPWVRIYTKTGHINKRESAHAPNNSPTKVDSTGWAPTSCATNKWQPACTCRADTRPGIVLDPFMGSGTTALVARYHGRSYIGCDLNRDYVYNIAQERLRLPNEPKPAREDGLIDLPRPNGQMTIMDFAAK